MIQLNWYKIFGVQIPDGSTVLPTDDIQIWLHCANIWDKAYTTLAEVLADSTTLSALISDNNATDYLVRSTTWASGMCADSTAMTYIGLNNYCANKLLADATWCNAICNSTYFESVLNVKVPTMTSDTTPEGLCAYSNAYSDSYWNVAYKVFDGDTSSNGWLPPPSTTNEYIYYRFKDIERLVMMQIAFTFGTNSVSPVLFDVIGSNDGTTWVDIASESITGSGSIFEVRKYYPTAIASYKYLGVRNTNIWFYTSGTRYTGLFALQFYGRKDVQTMRKAIRKFMFKYYAGGFPDHKDNIFKAHFCIFHKIWIGIKIDSFAYRFLFL